jgi:hypothetical protein
VLPSAFAWTFPFDQVAATPVPLVNTLLPPEPWRWTRTVLLGNLPLPFQGALIDAMTVAGSAIPLIYEQRWPTPVPFAGPIAGAAAATPQSQPAALLPPEPWRWVWRPGPPAIRPDLAQLVIVVDTDVPGILALDPRVWITRFAPRLAAPVLETLGAAFTQLPGILALDPWRWTVVYPPPPTAPRVEGAAAAAPQLLPGPLAQPESWRWEALRQSGVHRFLVWDPSFGASIVVVVAGDGSILSIDMPELGATILLGGGGVGGLT